MEINNTLTGYLFETNDPKYNILKVLEEMHEVGELLTKKLTKKGKYVPPDEKIIKEIGDLYLRLGPVARMFGEQAIQTHINQKTASLLKKAEVGEYKGGL